MINNGYHQPSKIIYDSKNFHENLEEADQIINQILKEKCGQHNLFTRITINFQGFSPPVQGSPLISFR